MRVGLGCLLVAVAGASAPAAMEVSLGLADVDRAVAIGTNRSERDRARFHATYRIALSGAPFDHIDVVTPLRRIVLMAEEVTRAGNRVGQREALALLERTRHELELRVEMTFHPMNTYVGVPAYGVELEATPGTTITPVRLDRVPRFGPRVAGVPTGSSPGGVILSRGGEPLLGGTLVATFDASRLEDLRGRYAIVVMEAGKVLTSARLDLAAMR
jgi:hypothetical protein